MPPAKITPVAIGGLGGSGTRVFSALLQHAGLYVGSELNKALDNLWFTVLFKQQRFVTHGATEDDLDQAVRLFTTAMTGGLGAGIAANDRTLLEHLKGQIPPNGTWRSGVQARHVDSLLNSQPTDIPVQQGWGWKEPNSHIFLKALDQRIPNLRYIHIVRDGLDMAFSGNTWQADHWGAADRDPTVADSVHQLRFWTRANHRTMTYGTTHMGPRFMVVSYEDFCANPQAYWAAIVDFLVQDITATFPVDLVNTSSIGRSADHDLSVFEAQDLEAAAQITQWVKALCPV